MEKARVLYIDQLKGIAILLVVIGHFIQQNTINPFSSVLFNIIYSFHMPFFMFLSGYVAFKTIQPKIFSSYFSFIQKKAIATLIPFFTWPLLINPYIINRSVSKDVFSTIMGLVKSPSSGLWFLWYLFFLYILYTAFLKLSQTFNKKQQLKIDIAVFSLILLPIVAVSQIHFITYLASFILHCLFFFLGIFVSKYSILKGFIFKDNVFALSMLFFLVLCGFYDINSPSLTNLFFKLVLSLCAIINLYFIVSKYQWVSTIGNQVAIYGKNSLIIYVLHFSLITVFSGPYILGVSTTYLFIIALFFSIITITICMIISKIVSLNSILNLIFFGRTVKKQVRV